MTIRLRFQTFIAIGIIVALAVTTVFVLASHTGASPSPRLLSVPITTGGNNAPTSGVTVDAAGVVTGSPDTVTVDLAVNTKNTSASAALTDNSNRMVSLIKVLKDAGAADKDISTIGLQLNPQYNTNGTVIEGYTVTNSVIAKLHNISKAGAMIDKAVSVAGDASRLNGVRFSIDDTSNLVIAARKLAVQNAKAKANTLADGAGVKLGSARIITETTTQPIPRDYNSPQAGVASGATAVPLQGGTQELTVNVTIVFDIG